MATTKAPATAATAASRCEEIERQIAAVNQELATLASQEPSSAQHLAEINAKREWAEIQRGKLVQQRCDLEVELVRERYAGMQQQLRAASSDIDPVTKEIEDLKKRLRDAENMRDRRSYALHEMQRKLTAVRVKIEQLSAPHNPQDAREGSHHMGALRARLLDL